MIYSGLERCLLLPDYAEAHAPELHMVPIRQDITKILREFVSMTLSVNFSNDRGENPSCVFHILDTDTSAHSRQ